MMTIERAIAGAALFAVMALFGAIIGGAFH